MKPIKHSISYVIYDTTRTKFLIVKRPKDDKDLPNVWGLPAGSVRDNKTFEQAVVRSGMEKLGVDILPVKFIRRGSIERNDFVLHMEEYEAEIIQGNPEVPQNVEGVTQYEELRWGLAKDLNDAASKGSLCSQLYLASINKI